MSFTERLAKQQQAASEKKREAKAYIDLAEKESRDLTADESAAIDQITDVELPKILADIERIEKLIELYDDGQTGGPSQHSAAQSPRIEVHVPDHARRRGSLVAYRDEADAYTVGQFLRASITGNAQAAQWCREHGVRNVLSTTDNATGGFLVPTQMERAIIDLREQYGVFRQECMVMPTAGDVVNLARRTGGVTASFVGENDEITASDVTWDNVEIVCRKLATMVRMSTEISEDAIISIADWVTKEIAYAFAKKEDECGFLGDGTSTYGGIVGLKNALAAGSIYTAATGNTAFSTLDLADFEGMIGKLPTYAEANARWYISKAGYAASMERLLNAVGGNTIQATEAGASRRMFLGYPVVISQAMNSTLSAQTSTAGLVFFGDLRQAAAMGERTGVRIKQSSERWVEYDQVGILGTQRFGLVVHERGTASAAGSIIGLTTPGS